MLISAKLGGRDGAPWGCQGGPCCAGRGGGREREREKREREKRERKERFAALYSGNLVEPTRRTIHRGAESRPPLSDVQDVWEGKMGVAGHLQWKRGACGIAPTDQRT